MEQSVIANPRVNWQPHPPHDRQRKVAICSTQQQGLPGAHLWSCNQTGVAADCCSWKAGFEERETRHKKRPSVGSWSRPGAKLLPSFSQFCWHSTPPPKQWTLLLSQLLTVGSSVGSAPMDLAPHKGWPYIWKTSPHVRTLGRPLWKLGSAGVEVQDSSVDTESPLPPSKAPSCKVG